MSTRPRPVSVGRPEATSHAHIERAAFELFLARGFEATSLDEIATAVGVSRRTLFNYYPSKNDIPWGQFDRTLDHFRAILRDQPEDQPLAQTIQRAVLQFNDFDPAAKPPHRDRMRLILGTPTLRAHSAVRYTQWREVIADYVAARVRVPADSLGPRVAGHVALALALSAYEQWLLDDEADLHDLLVSSFEHLQDILDSSSALARR